jgi:3-deoxy-D-manno-octulosonic-acid transferase
MPYNPRARAAASVTKYRNPKRHFSNIVIHSKLSTSETRVLEPLIKKRTMTYPQLTTSNIVTVTRGSSTGLSDHYTQLYWSDIKVPLQQLNACFKKHMI